MAVPPGSRVSIQADDFDVGVELARLRAGDAGVGAVAVFVGTVREMNDAAAVRTLELEHYPGMTEASIEAMIDAAIARFEIRAARVVHRIGVLEPSAQIVMVAVSAAHRGQAFQACEFLMDSLKTEAPFWKKESGSDGTHWVDARASDGAAVARWNEPSADTGHD